MVGRPLQHKGSGAPNGLHDEFASPDFDTIGPDVKPLIDPDAHVRLASKENLGGIRILRRGYNFTDGTDGLLGLDAAQLISSTIDLGQ